MFINEHDMEFGKWTPSWESDETFFWKDVSHEGLKTVLEEDNLVPTGKAHLLLVGNNLDFLTIKFNEFDV